MVATTIYITKQRYKRIRLMKLFSDRGEEETVLRLKEEVNRYGRFRCRLL